MDEDELRAAAGILRSPSVERDAVRLPDGRLGALSGIEERKHDESTQEETPAESLSAVGAAH